VSEVVRLIERASVPADGREGLAEWLHSWADGIASGDYGDTRSLVLVIESMDGQLAVIAQSSLSLDKARVVGLLACAAHREVDGNARIEDMRQ
jgi:hypothetical protein